MDFKMIGKLNIGKETETFQPYNVSKYESGWIRKRLIFNAICGDNRHSLAVEAGAFEDGHGDIYTFTKSSKDDNGNTIKGESIKIPFKDRLTSPRIAEVADFKKFIFDLEKPKRRDTLKNLVEKVKEGGNVTDDELKKVDVESVNDLTSEYEKSLKKLHEFISEWDFIDFIKKVLESDKYKNKKFYIRGSLECQYYEKTGKIYESYIPTRIYLADDNAEEMSEANLKILFNKDSLDDLSVKDKGKYYVNGYIMKYDRNRKENIPCPKTIAIPVIEGKEDLLKATIKKFTVDSDTWKEYGIIVNMLNGAQKTEITEDMLTDEQKEDLACGLITMEDIIADLGGSVYGERIQELQFVKPGRGFSKGSEETAYTDEDMIIKPLEDEEDDSNVFDDDEL